MSKTMAEVLETHPEPEIDNGYWYCTCGHDYGVDFTNADVAAHQQDMLEAAGFGLVADAKAEEWGVRWQAAGPFPEEVHAKPSKDAAEKSVASSAFPGVIVRRTVSEWEAAQ